MNVCIKRGDFCIVKPIEEGDKDHIRLKILAVVADAEYEIAYQVKRTALLIKLKKQYAKRVGLPLSSLRFFDANGNKINDSSTCKSSNNPKSSFGLFE